MKNFHLGDILSITTGYLVSPTHMKGIYAILNYMTDDDLYTHQLPRAMDECKPALLQWHPQLAEVDASMVTEDNWQAWLQEQVAKYGEYLPVGTLMMDEHEHIDPRDELIDMVGEDRVIVMDESHGIDDIISALKKDS